MSRTLAFLLVALVACAAFGLDYAVWTVAA